MQAFEGSGQSEVREKRMVELIGQFVFGKLVGIMKAAFGTFFAPGLLQRNSSFLSCSLEVLRINVPGTKHFSP